MDGTFHGGINLYTPVPMLVDCQDYCFLVNNPETVIIMALKKCAQKRHNAERDKE